MTEARTFTQEEQQQMYAMLERMNEALYRLKIAGVLTTQTAAQIDAAELYMDIRALIIDIDLDNEPDAPPREIGQVTVTLSIDARQLLRLLNVHGPQYEGDLEDLDTLLLDRLEAAEFIYRSRDGDRFAVMKITERGQARLWLAQQPDAAGGEGES